jgi:hypothetical protein
MLDALANCAVDQPAEADRAQRGLPLPAHDRAPRADGERRADPCAAQRGGLRKPRAVLRLCRDGASVRGENPRARSNACRVTMPSFSSRLPNSEPIREASSSPAARMIPRRSRRCPAWASARQRSLCHHSRLAFRPLCRDPQCEGARTSDRADAEASGRAWRHGRRGSGLPRLRPLPGGLPAGVQLFSLLKANPKLLDLLATILGSAPRLAEQLSRRPKVLDAVLDPGFFTSHADGSRDDAADRKRHARRAAG